MRLDRLVEAAALSKEREALLKNASKTPEGWWFQGAVSHAPWCLPRVEWVSSPAEATLYEVREEILRQADESYRKTVEAAVGIIDRRLRELGVDVDGPDDPSA